MKSSGSKLFFFVLIFATISMPQNRTAILLPAELKGFNASVNKSLIDDLTTFEIFLIQNAIHYSVIFADEFDDEASAKFDLIILPIPTLIRNDLFNNLSSALLKGTGIISFGDIRVINGDSQRNFCELLYEMETVNNSIIESQTNIQQFTCNTLHLDNYDNFELQLNPAMVVDLYKVNSDKIISFGCFNQNSNFTTSFFGYKSSGRFAHFGFSFNGIFSERAHIKQFENLLIKVINWAKKDSGIRVVNSAYPKKHLIVLVDIANNLIAFEDIIKKFKEKDLPVVLVSDKPEIFKGFSFTTDSMLYYGLRINCLNHNTDSLIKIIKSSDIQINFLIADSECLSEEDLKKISFTGLENILVKNSKNEYYNSVFDLVLLTYSEMEDIECRNSGIIVAEFPVKLDCDGLMSDERVKQIEELTAISEPFNRSSLINEILNSQLEIYTDESTNNLIIEVRNKSSYEISDVVVIVDNKKIDHKFVYDININGRTVFAVKNSVTGYYSLPIGTIEPKAKAVIKLLFDGNL